MTQTLDSAAEAAPTQTDFEDELIDDPQQGPTAPSESESYDWEKYIDGDESEFLSEQELPLDEDPAAPADPAAYTVTQHGFAKSPYSKLALVGSASVLFFLVVFAAFKMITSGFQTSQAAPKTDTLANQPEANPLVKENGQLKSKLVFAEQNNRDKDWMQRKPQRTVKVPPQPPMLVSRPNNSSAQTAQPLPVPAPPAPSVAYQPPTAPAAANRADPNQLWSQIAQASTYQVQGGDEQQGYQSAVNPVEQTAPSVVEAANFKQVDMPPPATASGNIKTIPVGTEVSAQLQIPVVASATTQQNAVLVLTSPLKAGKEVILPRGTQLVASVQSDGGAVNLMINSAYVNGNSVPIPGDSIVVVTSNKQPLVAESFKSNGGFGQYVMNFGLSAVSGAAQVLSSPTSSSTYSNGSYSTTTTNASNNMTTALYGAANGGVSSIITRMQAQNEAALQGKESPVAGIKAGTAVRLIFTAPAMISL